MGIQVTANSLRALLIGVTLAAFAGFMPGTPAFAQAKRAQPSARLHKILHDAQEDLKNNKYSDAIAKLQEADTNAAKTPRDQHIINDFLGYAYAKTHNYPEAAKAWEAEFEDGFLSPADLATKTKQLVEVNYQLKNYDKAIEYGNRAINGGFADDPIRTIVGQSYYLELLVLVHSACVVLSDDACTAHALEKLIQKYPPASCSETVQMAKEQMRLPTLEALCRSSPQTR